MAMAKDAGIGALRTLASRLSAAVRDGGRGRDALGSLAILLGGIGGFARGQGANGDREDAFVDEAASAASKKSGIDAAAIEKVMRALLIERKAHGELAHDQDL